MTKSIGEKAQALTTAFAEFINTIADESLQGAGVSVKTSTPEAVTGPATQAKAPAAKKDSKKAIKEAHDAAKILASAVMKEKGKDKLAELLAQFSSTKFNGVKSDVATYTEFAAVADSILKFKEAEAEAADDDDDLLGLDAPEAPATIEDVKALLVKVNGHPGLGNTVTKQLLAELGVQRLPELKKEKYAAAVKLVSKALSDADKTPVDDDDLGLD